MSAVALKVVGAELTVEELLDVANAEHKAAVRSAAETLDHARRAGEALLRAKEECGHGRFTDLVRKRCAFTHRTATNYMTVARRWKDFKVEKPSSLTAALAEIALTRVINPSTSDFDDDALKADERQIWLWPEVELPLSPRDPRHEREQMTREDGHAYRCPRCAHGWSGDPRPPLKGALRPRPQRWTTKKIPSIPAKERERRERALKNAAVARRKQQEQRAPEAARP